MKNIGNDPRSLFNGNHFSRLKNHCLREYVPFPRAGHIYIYMVESVRTYVSNTHAHVRMSVCY